MEWDRRQHLRVPFELHAEIRVDQRLFPCMVRDYSPGGVLVEFIQGGVETPVKPLNVLKIGQRVELLCHLARGKETEHRTVRGEIRYVYHGGIGIQFTDESEQSRSFFKELSDYERRAKQYERQTREVPRRPLTDAQAKLVAGFKKLVAQTLPDLVAESLRQAEDKLLTALDESGDNWLRADLNLAVHMLQSKTGWLGTRVGQVVCERIDLLAKGAVGNNRSATSSAQNEFEEIRLEVVEKKDYEDWLALNTAIRSLENDLALELGRVTLIFSELAGSSVDVGDCPVGPNFVLKTLRAGFNRIELPGSIHAMIFKWLGKSLQSGLKDLYTVMVSAARRFGVEVPEPAPRGVSIRRKPGGPSEPAGTGQDTSADRETSGRTGSAPVQAGVPAGTSSERVPLGFLTSPFNFSKVAAGTTQEEWSNELQQRLEVPVRQLRALISNGVSVSRGGSLAQSAHRFTPPPEAGSRASDTVDMSLLLDCVAGLYALLADQTKASGLVGKSLEEQITGLLAEHGKGQPLSPEDEDTIQIIDVLFNEMLKQKGIGEILVKWVEQLKLAVLKIFLLDHSLLKDPEHPARQFINQLGKLGAVKRGSNRGLEKVLEKFIHTVIDGYQGNNTVFDEVLNDVNRLVENQERAFARNAERIARSYEGQQKLARARKSVVQALEKRLAGKQVPRVVFRFIEEAGWKHYLVLTLLREGEESAAYQESLHAVDALLYAIGGESFRPDSDFDFDVDLEGPTLLQMIERELNNSGQTGYKAILRQLKQALLEDGETEYIQVDQYEWTGEGADEVRRLDGEETIDVRGRWQRKASDLSVGQWIEYSPENGDPQRMRLAWSGSNSYRFVFVSEHGLKDVDLTLEELAQGLEEGVYRVLKEEDVPLVDRGLHNMVHSVYESLASEASCDPLTGLLNRQEFERHAAQAVSSGMTSGSIYHLAYLDIDQFRVVNNSHGTSAGDHLLKHIARLISSNVSDDVVCGRIGGNEFGLIFTNQKKKVVLSVLERIRGLVMESPFSWEGSRIYVTLSIGMTELNNKTDSLNDFQRKAYLACEAAKEHGRNRIVEWARGEKDQLRQDEMMKWIRRIDAGLDAFLGLRCQEIRPIRRRDALSHYEVLLLVQNEKGDIVPPVPLIEAAEHYGRMSKIDRWVVEHTFGWMERHPEKLSGIDGLSINLSGISMSEDSFLEFLLEKLHGISAPRQKICFEVTETAAVASLRYATEFIEQVKKLGCKFALDDFGTGLSSYEYIQKMPVDYLKIDGVFIKNIVNNEKDQALVRSINDMAHFMNMKTIAEYVENEPILNLLGDIGVDKAQGYGIHKPMLLDSL